MGARKSPPESGALQIYMVVCIVVLGVLAIVKPGKKMMGFNPLSPAAR
uniref:Uncharacterized protein n=1 Tax=Candidatus Kentrum eta TaxID=2126337 RepID=A0A450UIL9_9GAMM|nr:MAG: hypothetical protein BECKH772A_GA0070896_1004211 [Candidatus Kentron sp. H]VFJ93336.1 MAG: hypothetical protein BECKH772B_GA0070898_1004211 [Candidatus Kentron sp. H]VFK00129.1 MAG: hypothetical protein BECKH772C_GA0070978_1004011 [Candidatus Kentron sp. H]